MSTSSFTSITRTSGELFDLNKDPEELRSVYGDASYAGVEATLKKELERLRSDYKLPEPEERPGARQPRKKNGKKNANENKKPKPISG